MSTRVPSSWIEDKIRYATEWTADCGPEHRFYELATTYKDAIRVGLEAMNQLPADDPIWKNTNGEPTVHKLSGWAQRELERNPVNETAHWVHFAALYDSVTLATLAIAPLLERDPSLIRLVVRLGQRNHAQSNMKDSLRRALVRLFQDKLTLLRRVTALRESPNREARETADIALRVFAGEELPA